MMRTTRSTPAEIVLRWAVAGLLLLCLLPLAVTAVWIATYADPDPLPRADAIVVLSGGLEPDGSYGGETGARVARGVALWHAGVAPRLVMTGDAVPSGGPPTAGMMRDAALAAGVPEAAIVLEPRAQSTLQNALYTAQILGPGAGTAPLVVVTHRYHLPRALLSFRWAGMHEITGIAADPETPEWGRGFRREALTWPLNLLRGAGFGLLMAAGVPGEKLEAWLR